MEEQNISTGCGDNCTCNKEEETKSCKGNCKCKETISGLKQQVSELNDKLLRSYAEQENFKKRVIKEKEELKDTTKVSLLSSILDMDNDLHIALKNIKDEDAKKGVELIISKLDKFLKSNDIESIQTDIYDSDLHEVVTVLNGGSNIIDVIGKGYKLNGKPFRYPKVILG